MKTAHSKAESINDRLLAFVFLHMVVAIYWMKLSGPDVFIELSCFSPPFFKDLKIIQHWMSDICSSTFWEEGDLVKFTRYKK